MFHIHGIPADLCRSQPHSFLRLSSPKQWPDRTGQPKTLKLHCVVSRFGAVRYPGLNMPKTLIPALPQVCRPSWLLVVFNRHCFQYKKGLWRSVRSQLRRVQSIWRATQVTPSRTAQQNRLLANRRCCHTPNYWPSNGFPLVTSLCRLNPGTKVYWIYVYWWIKI